MLRLNRVVSALAVAGALCPLSIAQTPPEPSGSPNPGGQAPSARSNAPVPTMDRPHSTAAVARRRSIVHHNPYPYPEYYHGDERGGFRNPGGTGRYLEYYPPGNQFQDGGRDPVRVATFDRGGGAPSRAEQIQAQQLGVQKDSTLMQHIDNYARPAIGFGFGVGYYGGYY